MMNASRCRALLAALACMPFCTAASADLLDEAVEMADIARFAVALELDYEQARRLSPKLAEIQQLAETHRATDEQALTALKDPLQKKRAALIAGSEVPGEAVAALNKADTDRQTREADYTKKLYKLLRDVKETFYARQNALIEWPDVGGESADEPGVSPGSVRSFMILQRMTAQMLQEIRYLPINLYVIQHVARAADYLSLFMDRRSPQFRQAQQMVIAAMGRVRQMSEIEFASSLGQLSVQLLNGLGISPVDRGPGIKPVSADEIVRILTNPQTRYIFSRAVRGGRGEGTPRGGREGGR